MTRYAYNKRRRSGGFMKPLIILMAVFLIVAVVGARGIYRHNLQAVSPSQHNVVVTIEPGSSVGDIADKLEETGLIRAAWAFELYVRNSSSKGSLQAGSYTLRPSFGVVEIVRQMTQGEVNRNLFTILPGQRLDQIRSALINNGGFSESEVDAALKPEQYMDEPALSDKPAFANLEGYLYPDSYEKTDATTAESIIREALAQMDSNLTDDIKQGFKDQGLSVHEGIILASIVTQEVNNPDDMSTVAQVFLSRLKQDMHLESDVTVIYGALKAGQPTSLSFDSEYNTFNNKGLTPGPISNVNKTVMSAVANPKSTDYLFFVAGDDGRTYFSRTLSEHERLVDEHCKKLCEVN